MLKPFGFQLNIKLWEMAFAYYKITDTNLHFPMWFQFDYPDEFTPTKLVYGFPPVQFGREGFVRLAVDWASHTFNNVSERKYVPRDVDIEITRQYIKNHMRGVSSTPIDMTAAIHPQLVDNLSVIDYLPTQYVKNRNIILCACGWAFKFAPLFGKICSELAVEGESQYDIHDLRLERPHVTQPLEKIRTTI